MKHKSAYIWNFGGRIVPQIVFLITNIILAHFLTPAEFGMIGVLAVFISISSTLTDAGFGGSLIKEETISKIDISTVFIYNLVVSIVLYVILFFSAPLIEQYFDIPELTSITRALCLVFVINAWAIIPKTILLRNLKFKQISIISVIGVIIASSIAIFGAHRCWGAYALVAYQLMYGLVDVVLLSCIAKYKISFGFSRESFKKLFSFGLFTTICNVIDSAYENIMTFLFGKYIGISSAGYLYQAKKLETSATSSLAQTINTVAFPVLTRIRHNQPEFIKETDSLFSTFSLFLFPLFWAVAIYANEIVTLIYGTEWEPAGLYLSLLMIVGIFYVGESLVRNYIKSLGCVKQLAKITLIKRLVGLGCILIFLLLDAFYMLIGYIISAFIGYLFNIGLYSKLINRSIRTSLIKDFRSFTITIILGGTMLISKLLFRNIILNMSILLLLFIIYYLIYIPKTHGFNLIRLVKHK